MDRKSVSLIAIIFLILGVVAGTNLFQIGGPLGPLPTSTPSYTPTLTATATTTLTPTPTATPTTTPTSTVTPSNTPTPTATASDTPTSTPTYTPTYTATPTPTPSLTPTSTPIPPRIVFRSFRELGTLVTADQEAGQEIRVSVEAGIANLCGHGANHFTFGVIEAGVDFSKINDDSISYSLFSGYTIEAPAPQITSCRIEYIEQYDGSSTFCRTNWDVVRRLAQHHAMENFVDDAIENGILDRAKERAAYVIENFVIGLTGKPVIVEFIDPAHEMELPSSCESSVPHGWAFDEESSTWSHNN